MPAFLKDYSDFIGDGSTNNKGETLDAFLEAYDASLYQQPSVTGDVLIFTYDELKKDASWKVLLVKRSNHPCIGYWACPGGFAEMNEDLDNAARRELDEETGVKGLPLEQVAAYGNMDRDPRTHIITALYMSAIKEDFLNFKAADDAADALLFDIDLQSEMVDHDEWVITIHHLTLTNNKHQLTLKADVEEKLHCDIIKERHYKVLNRELIGMDHAAMIVQCYLRLMSRL